MDVNQIITRIGIIRTKANLSARALSLMIGKNSTYITKMEAGEFTPNLSTLFEIISACNCTAEEFFATNFATFRQDQQLCTLICNMPDKRKQTLLNFLQTIWLTYQSKKTKFSIDKICTFCTFVKNKQIPWHWQQKNAIWANLLFWRLFYMYTYFFIKARWKYLFPLRDDTCRWKSG